VLLGVLAASLVLVGQPSSAGTGALTLPHPVPITAVRYGEPPLKVLLVGDSMAGSLGVGLGALASEYNVRLANAGFPGCSASLDGNIELTYFIDKPGWPCVAEHPERVMAAWQAWVSAYRPDVVVYLARSDLVNQQLQGKWTSIGHYAFNKWFEERLGQAVSIFSSRGARVVLMTVPVSQQATLNPRPEDNPLRNARDGAILRIAARGHGDVTIYDLSQLLTPGFSYRSSGDNVPLRCADGIHFTTEAGIVVATDLYPRLWALVQGHRVEGGGGWALGKFPQATPKWYAKLNCG
jgi:hypothetical protein